MANISIPNIYPIVFHNINTNNNENPSLPPHSLIVSSSQPTTSAAVNSDHMLSVIDDSKSETSDTSKLQVENSYTKVERKPHSRAKRAEKSMSQTDKPITRTQWKKRVLETDPTSPAADEAKPTAKQKPKGKRGKKRLEFIEAPKKLPGTSFNICTNCGTVADKVKAKKCKNCQKFFFDHWAKRCRIPPCPNCHFSRKSRGCDVVPQFCERCGHPLKNDSKMDKEQRTSVEEASSVITEGESTSDTSSFQLSEDLHDIDNLSDDEDDESVLEDVERDSCLSTDITKGEEHANEGTSESCDRRNETHDVSNKSHDSGEAHDTSDKSRSSSDAVVVTGDKSHDISDEASAETLGIADKEEYDSGKTSTCVGDSDTRDESDDHIDDVHDASDMSHGNNETQVESKSKSDESAPVGLLGSLERRTNPKSESVDGNFTDFDEQPLGTASTTKVSGDDEAASAEPSGVITPNDTSCSSPVDSSQQEAVNITSTDLEESVHSVTTTDDNGKISLDGDLQVESDSYTVATGDPRMKVDNETSTTSHPSEVDSLKDECMETSRVIGDPKSHYSMKQSTEIIDNELHQCLPLEPSQGTMDAETGDVEAARPMNEGQIVLTEEGHSGDVADGSKQEIASIRCSSQVRFDEQVDTDSGETKLSTSLIAISLQENPAYSGNQDELVAVDPEDTIAQPVPCAKKSKRVDSPNTTSKGRSSKASIKSVENKSSKKRSKKNLSIETTPDSISSVAAAGDDPLLIAGPPQQDTTDEVVQVEDLAKPCPTVTAGSLDSSSEVAPLQSTSGMTQNESSMVKLLQPLAKMTAGSMTTGLFSNLVENLKQNTYKLIQKEVSPSSSELNQQTELSQQECQQLIDQTALLLNSSSGSATGNGSGTLLPSNIQLPQKRGVSEMAKPMIEEDDLSPSSHKKLRTSSQGGTFPISTSIETAPAVESSKSSIPFPDMGMKEPTSDEVQPVCQLPTTTLTSGISRVIQTSSKLFPRSASLPPQLVPSSSLAMQESDDDSFLFSSTPSISLTLPPPPLKPTSPTGNSADPSEPFSLQTPVVLSDTESVPKVSVPSLVSRPAPPGLESMSDTFASDSSKVDGAMNVSTPSEGRPSSHSSVIMRVGPSGGIQTVKKSASSVTSPVNAFDPLNSSGSHPPSLSPGVATGSFQKLEIGSPPTISGQPNKIRVSLLRSDSGCSETTVASSASSAVHSPSDDTPLPMAFGSMALPVTNNYYGRGKLKNFALAPNLSVIATVETRSKVQASSFHLQQGSRLSPANSDGSSDSRPKSDSQELQKTSEDNQTASNLSSRQCTPEEMEEQSYIPRGISTVLSRSDSVGSQGPSQSQLQHLQLPSLVGPISNLPIVSRSGAVSVTVIKSSSQNTSDSLFSNASIQATKDSSPGPAAGRNTLPGAISASGGHSSATTSNSSVFRTRLPNLSAIASLPSPLAQGILKSPVSSAGIPSVAVQAAAAAVTSSFRKIAPRKPAPSGIVTIQVCNALSNSNSVTAAKMTSQSVGVGTEPSTSQATTIRMSPGILQSRPSAQIGGVLVTPHPSVGAPNPSPQPTTQAVPLSKAASVSGANSDASLISSSSSSRSVYVTKLYSNMPSTGTTQSVAQGCDHPRVRPSLKALSSPAFEEALLSAAKHTVKPAPPEEEDRDMDKVAKKEKKKAGKGKGVGGGKSPRKSKKNKGKSQGEKGEKFTTDEGEISAEQAMHTDTLLVYSVTYSTWLALHDGLPLLHITLPLSPTLPPLLFSVSTILPNSNDSPNE